MSRVALVLVSHSADAARGTAEIAAQMAPDVVVRAAGGTEDGGIGTSPDRVLAAVTDADGEAGGAGVVVLTDLGSAVMTAEVVLEMLDDDVAGRTLLADAPFVEGAVAAAVAAQQGGAVEQVRAAAQDAGALFAPAAAPAPSPAPGPAPDPARAPAAGPEAPGGSASGGAGRDGPSAEGVVRATVTLRNRLGLHARPAAVVARAVAQSGAAVSINGVDGASVLGLMTLGAVGGQELEVLATGDGAEAAVRVVIDLVEGGFGEA